MPLIAVTKKINPSYTKTHVYGTYSVLLAETIKQPDGRPGGVASRTRELRKKWSETAPDIATLVNIMTKVTDQMRVPPQMAHVRAARTTLARKRDV